jgi:membrane protein
VSNTDNADETEKPATGIPALVQKVMKLKPVRVFLHYASNGGPLMAAGMSYQALFAVFAALWAGFSIDWFSPRTASCSTSSSR